MKLVMGICDRLLVLHHGELLAQGTPAEIGRTAPCKRVYLGSGSTEAVLTAADVRGLNAWYGSSSRPAGRQPRRRRG